MRHRLSLALAAIVALALSGTALTASTASISIDTVGGHKVVDGRVKEALSGNVAVAGRSGLASQDAPAAKPLVADAGDSPFAPAGEPATLLGAGFGGSAPYSF